jgi:hypothetical protein
MNIPNFITNFLSNTFAESLGVAVNPVLNH